VLCAIINQQETSVIRPEAIMASETELFVFGSSRHSDVDHPSYAHKRATAKRATSTASQLRK
jgi:hypothetical protein